MTVWQKEQLRLLATALTNRKINTYWIFESNKINCRQIIYVIRSIHSMFKKKGVIIHAELNEKSKHVSIPARTLLKYTPVVLYCNECNNEKDYASLKYMSQPKGCMFNSCLGNTLYIKANDTLSVCPKTPDILLNPLKAGDTVNSIFDTADFRQLLLRQIEKRDYCKNNCHLFNICHGGCPAQYQTANCSVQQQADKLCLSENAKREQEIKKLAELYRS